MNDEDLQELGEEILMSVHELESRRAEWRARLGLFLLGLGLRFLPAPVTETIMDQA